MFNLIVRAVVIAAALLATGSNDAHAQTITGYPCGRVNEYTPATATTAGSITFGTARFELEPGSAPNHPVRVGADMCVHGEFTHSGAMTGPLAVTPMGPGFCGIVTGHSPATATADGTISLSALSGRTHVIGVAAGTTFTQAQLSGGQCFKWGVGGPDGSAEIFAYEGPWDVTATASPAPGSSAPPPSTLPSTDTAAGQVGLFGAAVIALGVLALAALARVGLRR